MISKLSDPVVPEKNPFVNCKLGRERYAKILTQIVANYTKGGVIALDGVWGTGKTTFIRMWAQDLKNKGFSLLFFNAWEDDFVSDPLVGLIGQFYEICKTESAKTQLSDVIDVASGLLASATKGFLKSVAKKCVGDDVVDAVTESYEDKSKFKIEVETYQKQRTAILDFRKALEKLVQECKSENPLIFIVDELDRCNPYYAVKLLERIKHLFDIPNVVFVLSIDKEQLCSSIRGYFGTDKLNAEEYLQKFINLEYQLPQPDAENFCKYLYDTYDMKSLLPVRNAYSSEVRDMFEYLLQRLFEKLHLSLREMDRLYSHMCFTLQSRGTADYIHPGVLLLLLYLRKYDSEFYNVIKERKSSIQEIITYFESDKLYSLFVPNEIDEVAVKYVTYCLANVLVVYSRNRHGRRECALLAQDNMQLNFKCNRINEEVMLEAVNSCLAMQNYANIYTYITHVELLNGIRES